MPAKWIFLALETFNQIIHTHLSLNLLPKAVLTKVIVSIHENSQINKWLLGTYSVEDTRQKDIRPHALIINKIILIVAGSK